MSQREVPRDRLDLKDDPRLLSRPIIAEPLYRCATSVTVLGFVPHAEIDIEVAGIIVVTVQVDYPMPNGAFIKLPNPLGEGQPVRARQRTSSGQSIWSAPVIVRDHTQDYPAGPPRPQINPPPVYQCGSRTGVSNLLIGGNVWITADGSEVGRVNGCQEQQGVDVNPDYGLNQKVRAWFELCRDPSPPSEEHITQALPSPLPTPGFDPVYEGGEQVKITNIVNGARVTLYRNGVNQGTWRCWGYALLLGLSPRYSAGETLEASQLMCPSNPASLTGGTTVKPCSNLPAPLLGPIQIGDDRITLVEFVPDAVIKVYINGAKVGEGGGPVLQLTTAIKHGDTIHVEQVLGNCRGQTVREAQPSCVAPPVTYDPSAHDFFPVGYLEYAAGNVKGSVYYPADDDGSGQPFNRRLAALGRAPMVFMAHGNHATHHDPNDRLKEDSPNCPHSSVGAGWLEIPNHKGYDYFQRQLARMGIIAVSVDCNETNGCTGGRSNIERRADLIIASIDHFRMFDADPNSIFHQHIDFQSVGLMGHSRGGEAVILVPQVINLAGVGIRGVISLAPTDWRALRGPATGYAFMTILPAGDGDVWDNGGAKFYDRAIPGPFKCQLYVHYTNHNFWNRQWPQDDGNGPPVMSRHDHERVLSVYGCAFYGTILLGHPNMLQFLTERVIPAGVAAANVHRSFEWNDALTVDNHEDRNGIGLNSLNLQTMQSMGLSADEFPFRQGGGSFNKSFFGNSTGMVVRCQRVNGLFRSQLGNPTDLAGREIWIRAAEVYNEMSVPAGATGFELGLEDDNGAVAWVGSDSVGGLPRPYDRKADDLADQTIQQDGTKTMLKTLRFPGSCFAAANPEFKIGSVKAILIRCNRGDDRALAFDDLQIWPKP